MENADQPLLATTAMDIGYSAKRAERCIAAGLDLELKPGAFICLLGPNGSGKSTLIRTLAGMQPPLRGELTLGDRRFRRIAPRERARRISVVLTEATPPGMMHAYSFVSLGRHPYSGWLGGLAASDRVKIEEAFGAVGAEALAPRLVSELSDGERQKIAIARALAQEAQVMLLDEPTAFLDLPRRVELMQILRNLAHQREMALLLSTHDLDLALRFADRLWLFSESGTLSQGYPETLALDGTLARAFKSSSLDWDPGSGAFRAHPVHCLEVQLEGSGLAALWTRRALERMGFGLTADRSRAAFVIEVVDAPQEPCWTVREGAEARTFASLDALIGWVEARSRNPNPGAKPADRLDSDRSR